MTIFKKFFNNKKIIITGHTGFKGSWLSLWCVLSGAKVIGISKSITSNPCHFKKLNLNKKMKNIFMDIKDLKKLKALFKKYQPDFVFHLAAQSLVKKSFEEPFETFSSNTVGTLNVLESLLVLKKKCHAVIITSDKSYKNLEIQRGYTEDDLIGGDDPYSGSKGAAEIIIQSYFKSFISSKKNLSINVARAGNVIGGGDWSNDRVIPDCIKSWSKNKPVKIRNPKSTRPWQHVLDVVRGYIELAIMGKKNKKKINGEAFNFGPKPNQNKSVIQLISQMKNHWKKVRWIIKKEKQNKKESKLLKLNSIKSKKVLNWETVLNFKEAVKLTALWYKNFYKDEKNCYNISTDQLSYYEKKVKKYYHDKNIKI